MTKPEFINNGEAQAKFQAQRGGEFSRNPIVPLTPDEIGAIRNGVLSPIETPKRNVENEVHNTNGRAIAEQIKKDHLFYSNGEGQLPWMGVSPDYFYLPKPTQEGMRVMGKLLDRFVHAASDLYGKSDVVKEVVRRGKNQATLDFIDASGDMPYSSSMFRPDLCLTTEGFRLTELELMIGGRGISSSLSTMYKDVVEDPQIVKPEGSEKGYAKMWKARGANENNAVVIISYEDSRDFKPELKLLAERSRMQGVPVWTNDEGELLKENGKMVFRPSNAISKAGGDIFVAGKPAGIPVVGIDRFFETYEIDPGFEMTNKEGAVVARYDAGVEPILDEMRNGSGIDVVPTLQHAYLEEKAILAFLHHPDFDRHWKEYFTEEEIDILKTLIPPTVVITPELAPQPIANTWEDLINLSGKDRELVIKKSGAAPDAWGARSVSFAQDKSKNGFKQQMDALLADSGGVSVMQKYAEGKSLEHPIYFPDEDVTKIYKAGNEVIRGRFTPFYYITENGIEMSDVMVTIRPGKKTHGGYNAPSMPVAFL